MESAESENPQKRSLEIFLNAVKCGTEAGLPMVFIEDRKEKLSDTLKGPLIMLKMTKFDESDALQLAKLTESATKVEIAKKNQEKIEETNKLIEEHQKLRKNFSDERVKLKEKHGLSEKQMLSIFEDLTKIST